MEPFIKSYVGLPHTICVQLGYKIHKSTSSQFLRNAATDLDLRRSVVKPIFQICYWIGIRQLLYNSSPDN